MLTNQSEGARNSTNQSLPPECNAHARYPSEGIKGTVPSFLRISFCDTYPTRRQFAKESCGADLKHVCLVWSLGVKCHFFKLQPRGIVWWRHLAVEIRLICIIRIFPDCTLIQALYRSTLKPSSLIG